jgi:hypothetical protein
MLWSRRALDTVNVSADRQWRPRSKRKLTAGRVSRYLMIGRRARHNYYMPTVPAGFVHQTQLGSQIANAVRKLGKEAVHVNYTLGADSGGEPSIFFRIVLADAASREDQLAQVTDRIATTLFDELRPHENWGLLPYFSFRSKSEQETRNDPEWA